MSLTPFQSKAMMLVFKRQEGAPLFLASSAKLETQQLNLMLLDTMCSFPMPLLLISTEESIRSVHINRVMFIFFSPFWTVDSIVYLTEAV